MFHRTSLVEMNGAVLLLTFWVFTFVAAIDHNCTHHRQKRFIFYPGSVLQLAAGLAIPADVKNKIIYTNYGIMINYDLPTNLSSLLPVTIVEELRGDMSWDQLTNGLLRRILDWIRIPDETTNILANFTINQSIFGWNKGCWQMLEEWLNKNTKFKSDLMYDFAILLLSEKENNEIIRKDLQRDVSPSFDTCGLLNGLIQN